MNIVILAGGGGSRLWPLSREDKPKQFCRLISEKTMLEETLDRFESFPKEKIFIATTAELKEEIFKILPNFPKNQVFIEPACRDTAPAMGLATLKLSLLSPDEPMAFIPSDHYIGRADKFIASIHKAEEIILKTKKLLDISIHPTSPNTALGYTKIGPEVFNEDGVEFYQFLGHTEKPNFKTAQTYLDSGDYLWHANYYMWTPRLFLEAYQQYAPALFADLEKIKSFLKDNQSEEADKVYRQMEKISIDYAIMEKMELEKVLIIKGSFDWKDIGAWDTLHENLMTKTDERRNLVRGERLNIDTSGCLIYGGEKKIIATIGLDDMIIVDTEDALLVCPKSRAQEAKKVVEELKIRGGKYI